MRSAYGLHTPAEDDRLTHVGPGTPAGELLRRYWQPVALSTEVTDLPRRVRLLGEDLVLFRPLTLNGGSVNAPGPAPVSCLQLHCPHRGTSLEWGRVEAGGIRSRDHRYPRVGR